MSGAVNGAAMKPAFTFEDLVSKVNGKYNRGEIKLNAQGGLSTVNGHVWMQVLNNTKTTVEENKSVREAVYKTLAEKFAEQKGIDESLKTVQEALLGSENAVKPLGRDEVRAMIAQLKAVSPKEEGPKGEKLSTSDFNFLLETIRAVKAGSPEVTRLPDGSFKLAGAPRSFSAEMVLSGLKTGSRASILQTATVNVRHDSDERRQAAQELAATRSQAAAAFESTAKPLLDTLWARLSDAFRGLDGNYEAQARKTGEVVSHIMREIVAEDSLLDSLDLDIAAFEKDVKEYIGDRNRAGISCAMEGSYRVVLDLAINRLAILKQNDTIEIKTAREFIRQAFLDVRDGLPVFASNEKLKPVMNEMEERVRDYINFAAGLPPAEILVKAFQSLVPSLALEKSTTDLVGNVQDGTMKLDDFVKAFVSAVKAQGNYPKRGADFDTCEKALEAIESGAIILSRHEPDELDMMVSARTWNENEQG